MSRHKKTFLAAVVLAVALAVFLGGMAHYGWGGGELQFDIEFYAKADPELGRSFSYDDYAATLKYVNRQGMVNYKDLKAKRTRLDAFCRLMGNLEPKVLQKWDKQKQLAFWINAYNALTLKVIIDNYPIKARLLKSLAYPKNSIRQIPNVWDKLQFLVAGQKMTLNQIEHEVLRKKFNEPRIHVALVCAAMSCPALRNEPYFGKTLNKQFDDQARKFLSVPTKFRVDRKSKKVHLSKIFKWFGADFIENYKPAQGFAGHSEAERSVLNFLSKHLSDADGEYLRTGKYKIVYLDYNWTLNAQKPKKE